MPVPPEQLKEFDDPWENFRLLYNWEYQKRLLIVQLMAAFLFMLVGTFLGSILVQVFSDKSLAQYAGELVVLAGAVVLGIVGLGNVWLQYRKVPQDYIMEGKDFQSDE